MKHKRIRVRSKTHLHWVFFAVQILKKQGLDSNSLSPVAKAMYDWANAQAMVNRNTHRIPFSDYGTGRMYRGNRYI